MVENNHKQLLVEEKKRIIEFDYIKTVLIFLVVFGHLLECFSSSGGDIFIR